MVPQVGLEPTRISALASKTSVATITPPGPTSKLLMNFFLLLVCVVLHSFNIIAKDSNLVNYFFMLYFYNMLLFC